MRISAEQREAAKLYIMEKIKAGTPSVPAYVSSSLGIDPSTVHRYIKELTDAGQIEKQGRGKYSLSVRTFNYTLSRESGDFVSDTLAYDRYLFPLIRHLPDNVISIWSYVFSEMTNNVIDHSEAENAYLSIRQDALDTTVILRDNGIGIFRKIADYYGMTDLSDAVTELFKGKLTTNPQQHSGEGIFFSSRMMDEFMIQSEGRIFSCNAFNEDLLSAVSAAHSPGTTVVMTLSNASKRSAAEIFDLYADVDGGFTRTMIPIAQVFPSAPVSRSQAKRICERLDSFKEVTLDFAGTDWIGQGFAHELFSVFAGNHPEVKLIPVNMSSSVEKMYRHVTGEKKA